MSDLSQFLVILRLNLRSLPSRFKASLVIVVSLVAVVGMLLSGLSLGEGIRVAYLAAGDPGTAIVLSAGALSDRNSSIAPGLIPAIEGAAGVSKTPDGSPLADAQIEVFARGLPKVNGGVGDTNLRGIGPHGLALIPHFRVVSGQPPRPGSNEMMIGVTAQRKFLGLRLGDTLSLQGNAWSIVGVFSTHSFIDGDLVVSSQRLIGLVRPPRYSSVLLRLKTPASFAQLRSELLQKQGLPLRVERLSDYWRRLWQNIRATSAAFIMIYTISTLIAAGALAGIIHVMHAGVSARSEEIAVLRALGFGGAPVAASVVLEAMVFACLGAAIATIIDWLWLEGYAYNGAFGVFRAAVTVHLFLVGAAWALVVAFIGALMPSIRAANMSIIDALGG